MTNTAAKVASWKVGAPHFSTTHQKTVVLQGWKALERRTRVPLADLAEERSGVQISFADTQTQPRPVVRPRAVHPVG